MRIVDRISHPTFQITIFLHDSKYAVKFESGLYEQTYKFRTGDHIQSVEDIKKIIDQELIEQVQKGLHKMHQDKLAAIGRNIEEEEEEIEEIISSISGR